MKKLKKTINIIALSLLVTTSLNASMKVNQDNFVLKKEVSCLQGAHLAADALGDIFNMSYEAEYVLFDNLYTACVLNGGWE